MNRRAFLATVAAQTACILGAPAAVHAMYRPPGHEHRSVSAGSYQLSVQNNGRVDVLPRRGNPVFEDAFPMVWLEGRDAPEPLPVSGRLGGRAPVRDAIGHGQGMVLRKKTCEWSLRVYPDQPFFAVQVAYVNTGDEPVGVRGLLPWCAGPPRRKSGLRFFEGDVALAETARAIPPAAPGGSGGVWSDDWVALARDEDVVLAGFLAERARDAWAGVASMPNADTGLCWFRAIDRFDPPSVVAPGSRLLSAVLYVSVVEHTVDEAVARFRETRSRAGVPPAAP